MKILINLIWDKHLVGVATIERRKRIVRKISLISLMFRYYEQRKNLKQRRRNRTRSFKRWIKTPKNPPSRSKDIGSTTTIRPISRHMTYSAMSEVAAHLKKVPIEKALTVQPHTSKWEKSKKRKQSLCSIISSMIYHWKILYQTNRRKKMQALNSLLQWSTWVDT